MRSSILSVCVVLVLILVGGCSGSKETVSVPPVSEQDRERALNHYMNGLGYDQKEEFANAIIEYQEALEYYKDPAIFNAISKDYSILGKHQLAIRNAKEAVRLEPENRNYRESLAEIYARAFEIDLAAAEYHEIIKLDSNYQTAWLNAARFTQLQRPLDAITLYHVYLDRFGPDWEVYLQLAQIYGNLGEAEKSAEALRNLLTLDPANAEIKKALGDNYLQRDSVDAALVLYNEIVGDHPKDVSLRASMAHAYLLLQDYGKAAEQFNAVMNQDSILIDDQIQFGQLFVSFIQKDSTVAPVARKLFESIRELHPSDWRPYWFLGAIANIMRDDSAALPHYQKITELEKGNVEGWVGAASIYYGWENFEKAAELLEEGKKYVASEFRLYFLLGVTYQRMQKLQDAALALEKAIQLDSKNIDALSSLALVYDELKRREDSDSLYERAIRLDPNNHLVLNNYGYSLAERGLQLERALRMAKEAVRQQPTNESYLDTMGWIYFRMENLDEAERAIKKAIDLGSRSAVIHEHLGDVYSKMEDHEKAVEYWKKALEIDEDNQGLREKIERGKL